MFGQQEPYISYLEYDTFLSYIDNYGDLCSTYVLRAEGGSPTRQGQRSKQAIHTILYSSPAKTEMRPNRHNDK